MASRVIRGFLSLKELRHLETFGARGRWIAGRLGTGYEKRELPDDATLDALTARALGELGDEQALGWDRYLLRYDAGDEAPAHRDEAASPGLEHRRINALVQAGQGGAFVLDGVDVPLEVGDAIVFRPDEQAHAVRPMRAGLRLVFSVGATFGRQ